MPGHRFSHKAVYFVGKDGRHYYQCRFCDGWKACVEFSSAELDAIRNGANQPPICKECARVALTRGPSEPATDEVALYESLPLESRYALICTFTGEYDGIPAFSTDILHRILTYIVARPAPFIADLGDECFRCTVCARDFTSFDAAMQHTTSSQRHVKALQRVAS
eukprot:TRINITY_DN27711_c0_g2_i1.p1 TRINITY_DN27711_c0_g2~~TRINITY_DN27711_c0_g2_i1.p1  ORF type:complete len:165 (+),score=10.41 TRINITY_DN27711_c0_g2_i1:48-542(+)